MNMLVVWFGLGLAVVLMFFCRFPVCGYFGRYFKVSLALSAGCFIISFFLLYPDVSRVFWISLEFFLVLGAGIILAYAVFILITALLIPFTFL